VCICVKMFAPPVLAEDTGSCRTSAGTDNMDQSDGSFSASKSAGSYLLCCNHTSCSLYSGCDDANTHHSKSFGTYWLCQLSQVRRSLYAESAATLVHAFVDYCNAVLAGASKSTIDKLQRVLNAAAASSVTH